MLPLLFAAIVFAFLLLGSLVFLGCVLVPPTRRYALSAAFWCAMWGPCSVAFMVLAGLGLVATAFITKAGGVQSFHAPKLLAAFGWSYLILGALTTTAVATSAAWLHQVLVRRLTFALFRLYASAISAGIGSVFGWCLGWWMMSKELMKSGWPLWVLGMFVSIAGFGTVAYKGARGLRGEAPNDFTWITPEEFAGP
jgi:hypothetical protein